MKIAYLTCVYPPYPGGMGYQAQGMAEELVKRGHEVHIYTPRLGGVKFEANSKLSNLPIIHYLTPWFRFGNAAFLPQLLWQIKDFDIIHLCYPFFGVAELLPLLRLIKSRKTKIIVHHLMDAVAPGWRGVLFNIHRTLILPFILRYADTVITISQDYFLESDLAGVFQSSVEMPPIDFVPNGVDANLFCPIPQLVIARSEATKQSHGDMRSPRSSVADDSLAMTRECLPIILFVGGLDKAHYFKGVDVLIEALRILQWGGVSFSCRIIGDGEMRGEYERHAKEAGLWQSSNHPIIQSSERLTLANASIEFVGLVAHGQLPLYYNRAMVVAVPSTERVECFSIVAAEAQSCGVPAIVSDFPGARGTIDHGVTGLLVRPGDPEDLASKLFEILEDQSKARKMGQGGRKRMERWFSFKVVGDKLEEIYESLYHP